MALTTRTKVKLHLGISDTSEDSLLDQLILEVDAWIKKQCGRDLESTSYTEFYEGTGTQILRLRHTPVTAITTVHEDNDAYWAQGSSAFGTESLLTAGTEYALQTRVSGTSYTGLLFRIGAVWPSVRRFSRGLLIGSAIPGLGNIKVAYTAGYSSVPADLELLANILVAVLRRNAQHGDDVQSESLNGYSYTLNHWGKGWQVKIVNETLHRYRKMRP